MTSRKSFFPASDLDFVCVCCQDDDGCWRTKEERSGCLVFVFFVKGLARQDVDSLQSKQHGIIAQMFVKLPGETLIPVNGDADITFIFLLGGTKKKNNGKLATAGR